MQQCFYINNSLLRRTSKVLIETIYSILAFKIDVIFVTLKKITVKKNGLRDSRILLIDNSFIDITNVIREDQPFNWDILTYDRTTK